MKEIVFLTLAEVVEIHNDQIKNYGGQSGVRDMGLLESALSQPEASFGGEWLHADLFEMAAAYLYHLCQNHAFLDGNKRVALASALVFLELNGVEVLDPKGVLVKLVLSITGGREDKVSIAKKLKELSE